MANEEHLAMLRRGVDAWNAWREKHRAIPNLHRANLTDADLTDVNLIKADLGGADLGYAKLVRADLRFANLYRTDLSGAELREADLHGAGIFETAFANIDLSTTKGLESCRHGGPSILDHRTLQRSGRLPLAFLRGCGLPERLIEYLPSLLEQADSVLFVLHQLLVEGRLIRPSAARRPAEQRRAMLVRAARPANRRVDLGRHRRGDPGP
jgi:hypothetical protein